MAVEIIETASDGSTLYRLPQSFDGVDFILRFSRNGVDGHWFLRISDEAGVTIKGCASIRLVDGLFPLWRVTDPRRPAGELLVLSDTEGDPGLKTLGPGLPSNLLYIQKETVDEWRSSV
jgi:hypothetical protein